MPRARLLQVLRDGESTSVVAQMLHSNAVLKFAVFKCLTGTNTLKRGQIVDLRVLACTPPDITVELSACGGEADGLVEQTASTVAIARKRQFLPSLA